ncbi:hypothetical protein DFA_06544 [Cavenderia fasciculata]|uniref:Methylmalonic aciduria and homocystinuria type D protein n=1 Tax=Cavenderia fasciculata TaxID=261658 RepID=F4PJA8_CACFS|nr:uncharacterized protein DFA_06544 [Cavenderia fasciculata]EGG24394.1 hypothetical protein DFA_06544 [Cavenderia fasciculata]|eukprot:XP_004362245.1 hypothetical protein DFA_06544 [Cavenderia fasciculata]
MATPIPPSSSSSSSSTDIIEKEIFNSNNDKSYTIKKCTHNALKKNLKEMFPTPIQDNDDNLYVVMFWFKTDLPMSGYSDKTETERETQASKFAILGNSISTSIIDKGYWSDFIDPMSGIPSLTRENANAIFVPSEHGHSLGIEIVDVGCCQVMVHPLWKVRAFFSMVVASAPLDVILDSVNSNFN